MKLIVANIRPEKLEPVREALDRSEVAVVHVSEVADTWHRRPCVYRGVEYQVPDPRLRLEILIEDDIIVSEVLDAIARAAFAGYAGLRSSGDLAVVPIEYWTAVGAQAAEYSAAVGHGSLR